MNFFFFLFSLSLLLLCAADLDCTRWEIKVERNGTMVCELEPSFISIPYVWCTIPGGEGIQRNEVAFLGQKKYECEARHGGRDVELIETMRIDAKCENEKRSGDTWIEANAFKYVCAPYGQIHFVGCITPGGTEIPAQETKMIGNVDVTCHHFKNGTVTMSATKEPSEYECKTWAGESKAYGDIWNESTVIRVFCSVWGRVEFMGCSLPNRFSDDLRFGKYYKSGPAFFFCDKRGTNYTLHVNDPEE